MDEWSFILKVRVFAHSNGEEAVDRLVEELRKCGLGHWEFDDLTHVKDYNGKSKRTTSGGSRQKKVKDIPENRTYV